jgi:hypothetical protein
MLNLKARAHVIHVHIRYAENNSNIVKTQCLLIPLNVPDFPATNRSKSSFRAMITWAQESRKRILWQDYVFLIADCVKCETSYERRQFLSTCIIPNAGREQIKIINTWMNECTTTSQPSTPLRFKAWHASWPQSWISYPSSQIFNDFTHWSLTYNLYTMHGAQNTNIIGMLCSTDYKFCAPEWRHRPSTICSSDQFITDHKSSIHILHSRRAV